MLVLGSDSAFSEILPADLSRGWLHADVHSLRAFGLSIVAGIPQCWAFLLSCLLSPLARRFLCLGSEETTSASQVPVSSLGSCAGS